MIQGSPLKRRVTSSGLADLAKAVKKAAAKPSAAAEPTLVKRTVTQKR